MKTVNALFAGIISLFFQPLSLADQCPTPEQVRERSISRAYDWSVGEDVTLDMLLEISGLDKVSLQNHGEFVSCHYYSAQIPVRMDGVATADNCLVTEASGEWFPLPDGTLVCNEIDPENCQFQIECFQESSE